LIEIEGLESALWRPHALFLENDHLVICLTADVAEPVHHVLEFLLGEMAVGVLFRSSV
jgi:hypothetical protein